jgi:putative Mg2+ transporter-C (MgtC) family protein
MIEISDQLVMLGKVVLAALLAGTVGYEREMEHKPAGLRTHMIMGGSAALIISLGEVLTLKMLNSSIGTAIHADPIRLIQGMIIGLSFIGGGTILKLQKEQRVKYLTTAASLFFSTGIGIGIAADQYALCTGVALFVFLINHFVGKIEKYIYSKQSVKEKKDP